MNTTGDPSVTSALQGKVAWLANEHLQYRVRWFY